LRETRRLVPGLWLTGATWGAVVPALRAAGHVAHPLTLPGMGDDDIDPTHATLADHVAAVVDAIDACSGLVLLVGHSAGSGLAWAAADAGVDRVAGLVLVGGFPIGDGQLLADGFAASGSLVPFPGWDAFDDAEVRDLDAGMRARVEAQMRPSPARIVTEPQRLRDDRRYQLPVTMVCSEFSPDDARSWVTAGAAPVAELARLDAVHWVDLDSGHWPQASCPDRLAEVVLDAAERAHRG
jgi:pimeloyl-ACP methyl ester carboxylesterase